MKANSKRVNALIKLGVHLKNYNPDDEYYGLLKKQVHQAIINNGWFTAESIRETFSSWGNVLVQDYFFRKPYNYIINILISNSKKNGKVFFAAGMLFGFLLEYLVDF